MSSVQQAYKRDAYLKLNARNILKSLFYAWFFEPCSKPRKSRVRKDRTLLRVEGPHGQSSYCVVMLAQLCRSTKIDTFDGDLELLGELDPHGSCRDVCIRVVC